MNNCASEFTVWRQQIEVRIKRLLVESNLAPLHQVLEYSLVPTGKCMRPLLLFSLCCDLKGESARFLPAALALEFVHVASLIHDDLPALDNDDYRRGRLSCHRKFGEGQAILAGDLLVSHAFSLLLDTEFEAREKILFVRTLSTAFDNVCLGQSLDLLPAKGRGDLEELYNRKTGALFGAAAKFAAIGCNLEESLQLSAWELGLSIGFSFQIIDDFIDLFGAAELRGRPTSSDSRNLKRTYFLDKNTKKTSVTEGLKALQLSRSKIHQQLENFSKLIDKSYTEFENTLAFIAELFSRVESLQASQDNVSNL